MNASDNKTGAALTRTPVVLLCTFICCFLWGSAFPSVKTGYRLFSIQSSDTGSLLLFAGIRFTLAGILVLIICSIITQKFLLPKKSSLIPILILAAFQTFGQYYFFYIGMAHTSGVTSSIMEASGTFFTILIAALLFRSEKLTIQKIAGCLIGFAGVVLIQSGGKLTAVHMHWNGEGFILLSAVFYALSSSCIKEFSKKDNPMMLSGWQFVIGGISLCISGLLMGGHMKAPTPTSGTLLLYMAFISAGAYTLWSLLLKYNPVSKISVFGFMNPVIGVILSALILHEANQAFSLTGLLSLALVSLGIIIVFRGNGSQAAKKPARQ